MNGGNTLKCYYRAYVIADFSIIYNNYTFCNYIYFIRNVCLLPPYYATIYTIYNTHE